MKRALIIRHAAPETLGANFTGVLEASGFALEALDIFELAPAYGPFPAPDQDALDLIVSIGGPLSANDEFPALAQEMALLKDAHEGGIPVFAVCLGAQLLCRALGGRVEPTGGYQFGLRKLSVTEAGDLDPVFGNIRAPLVPTLHGECFSVPPGGAALAEGDILLRDGGFRRISMAYHIGKSYGFQFEPQLTYEELVVWNRELYGDYLLMGDRFDPQEEAARNLREFARFAPVHEAQMAELLRAFLANAGL
ncbi:MAG: type 1 glutamine amidotransferase [Chloroflexota bacterium]|nr:type 1 glutamine amidotransferase [Chloroflexota bacterium]